MTFIGINAYPNRRKWKATTLMMKNRFLLIKLIVLLFTWPLFFLLTNTGYAYFIPSAYGVRPAGMGEAFVSVADDANTVLYNPAGLALIKVVDIESMYSDLYSNLNARLYTNETTRFGHNFIAIAVPFTEIKGSFAISWLQFSTAFYSENTTNLTYGGMLLSTSQNPWGIEIATGASLKMLQWMVERNEYSENFTSRQQIGYTVDLGVLARFENWITVGICGENLLPVDMGITTQEYVPVVFRSGVSCQWPLSFPALEQLQSTVELDIRDDKTANIYDPKFGLESWWWNHLCAIRAGITPTHISTGLSFQYPILTTLKIQGDYAFSYPFAIQSTTGSHRFGLGIHWDIRSQSPTLPPAIAPDPQLLLQKAIEVKITEATEALQSIKLSIKTASDATHAAEISSDNTKKIFDEIVLDTAYETSNKVLKTTGNSRQAFLTAKDALAIAQQAEQSATQAYQAIEALLADPEPNGNTDRLLTHCKTVTTAALTAQQAATTAVESSESAVNFVEEAQLFKYNIYEKNTAQITIGIEETLFKDFADSRKLEAAKIILNDYLKRQTSFPIIIKSYRLDELKYAFLHGEVDLLVSYSNFFNAFYKHGVLSPVLTIQKNHKDSQPYCLIILENSPIMRASQVQHKRLGYPSTEILSELKTLLNKDFPNQTIDQIFLSKEKFNNRVDALLALQIDVIDMFFESEYIFDIYSNRENNLPKKIKRLDVTQPIPHRPIYLKSSRNDLKNKQMQTIITAMKDFHLDPSAQAFLQLFHFDRFISYDELKHKNHLSAE